MLDIYSTWSKSTENIYYNCEEKFKTTHNNSNNFFDAPAVHPDCHPRIHMAADRPYPIIPVPYPATAAPHLPLSTPSLPQTSKTSVYSNLFLLFFPFPVLIVRALFFFSFLIGQIFLRFDAIAFFGISNSVLFIVCKKVSAKSVF